MINPVNILFLLTVSFACSPNNLTTDSHKPKTADGHQRMASDVDMKKTYELNSRAELFAQFGHLDSALILYDQVIELDPNDYLPHSAKRSIYLSMKQFNNALKESENILQKASNFVYEWNFTGMLHEWLGDSETAMNHYQKAAEISKHKISNPTESDSINMYQYNLIVSYLLLEDETKRRAELKNYYKKMPDEFINMSKTDFIKYQLRIE